MNNLSYHMIVELLLILLLSVASTIGQSQCPQVGLKPPGGLVQPEDKVVVAAEVLGGIAPHRSLSFEWFVSSGKILNGQGKQTVEIQTQEEDAGTALRVALLINGLPKECTNWAVTEFGVAPYPIGEPVDQFSHSEWKKDRYFLEGRLDAYFTEIRNNPGYEGFVTIEFDKKDSLASKIAYLQRIYRHVAFRKFDPARITFALAEHNGTTITTLWTMHPQAKMPKYARNYRIIRAENYRNRLNCIFPLD